MRKKGWGRIVNIASAHGLVASEFKSAYVAAKHGLVGFTKTIALETATQHITVNAICPGYVQTPLVAGQIKDQARRRITCREADVGPERSHSGAEQPTKEFVAVEDVAALALFICAATRPRASPARHCRSTAAGRRTKIKRLGS